MPFKTGVKDDGSQGIPILNIESEWFDYVREAKDVWSKSSDLDAKLRARGNGDQSLYGFYADVGSGHCNVGDDSMPIVALFLRKAVAARIPANAPTNGPVLLDLGTFEQTRWQAHRLCELERRSPKSLLASRRGNGRGGAALHGRTACQNAVAPWLRPRQWRGG